MTRDRILFLILGALAVAVVVLGYQLYQDRKKTTGIDINIGERVRDEVMPARVAGLVGPARAIPLDDQADVGRGR